MWRTVALTSISAVALSAQTTGPAAPKDRGDVIFIPPGVAHGIKQSAGITYLNIRFEAR